MQCSGRCEMPSPRIMMCYDVPTCPQRNMIFFPVWRRLLQGRQYSSGRRVSQLVEKVASQPIHPFSINGILKYTARSPNQDWLCTSANWLQKEMPVRLAHRLHDFDRLPHVVVANSHIQSVYELYCQSFEDLYRFGFIKGAQQEARFTERIKEGVQKHSNVVDVMAKGVSELRVSHPDIVLDSFLDRFFVTRIGNRVLAEHHIANHESETINPDFCGVVNRNAKPAKIIGSVAATITQSSMCAYGVAPEINITGDMDLSFAYVPEHIRYVAHELLKNSVRATVELHGDEEYLPPIYVSIYKGNADVFIKIFDRGGGIPASVLSDIWKYGYSTADVKTLRSAAGGEDPGVDWEGGTSASESYGLGTSMQSGGVFSRLEMAGYGFGLPLSRLYTRYFGGDLDIKTMQGIGTDTYVLLPRLGNQRESDIMLHNQLYHFSVSSLKTTTQQPQHAAASAGHLQ
eukprot:GHVQ01025166.1.p2 GENE.GHVQ01025166.1~~GHVQ01025166.1.p2  ORF type:complete len:458 (+),score=51.01 GHVQ01025166.1:55-1428(+)